MTITNHLRNVKDIYINNNNNNNNNNKKGNELHDYNQFINRIHDIKNQMTGDIDNHKEELDTNNNNCLLYTSPSPRDRTRSRMPSSA